MTQSQGSFNRNKTKCPQGHEYTEENTYTNPQGRRWCRACARLNAIVQTYKKYGLIVEEVQSMMQAQEGLCAICKKDLFGDEEKFKSREIQIDHDHSCCGTNKGCENCVRGILCGECNRGLSRFNDDADRLRAAADYLDKYAQRASTN
jgi:hypothetical protein